MDTSKEKPRNEPYVDPVIEAYKPGIDRTLIRYNLRLSVQQRFENLEACLQDAHELGEAMRKAVDR